MLLLYFFPSQHLPESCPLITVTPVQKRCPLLALLVPAHVKPQCLLQAYSCALPQADAAEMLGSLVTGISLLQFTAWYLTQGPKAHALVMHIHASHRASGEALLS